MTTVLKLHDDWRHIATIELIDASMELEQVLASGQSRCRISPNSHAPSGRSWFDVRIDFSPGGREAAHAAFTALSAMQKAADRGMLHGYRIVNGRHWLELAGVLGCEDGVAG
ncbi:hypothetical protein [Dokdonella sp.]|uniref:hypothetical protein n=1 Tax=Dokdonella sp. TaxID=2291710 RepID=UPI00378305DB